MLPLMRWPDWSDSVVCLEMLFDLYMLRTPNTLVHFGRNNLEHMCNKFGIPAGGMTMRGKYPTAEVYLQLEVVRRIITG